MVMVIHPKTRKFLKSPSPKIRDFRKNNMDFIGFDEEQSVLRRTTWILSRAQRILSPTR